MDVSNVTMCFLGNEYVVMLYICVRVACRKMGRVLGKNFFFEGRVFS